MKAWKFILKLAPQGWVLRSLYCIPLLEDFEIDLIGETAKK